MYFLAQVCGCCGHVYAPLAQDEEVKKANPSQPPSPAPTATAGGGGASDQTGRDEEHVKEDESTMMAATSTGEEGEGGRRRERREGRSLRGKVIKSKPFPLNCGREERNTRSDILLHLEAVSEKAAETNNHARCGVCIMRFKTIFRWDFFEINVFTFSPFDRYGETKVSWQAAIDCVWTSIRRQEVHYTVPAGSGSECEWFP